jgi:HK97 family phage portal protein
VATFAVPGGDQLVTPGGHPTGLARPSVPLSEFGYGRSGLDLIGGQTVSFAQLYRTQIWVAVCVHKIARQISRLPLKAYRRSENGRERITSGNLAALLKRPWPGAGQTHLKQAMALPALVHGGGVLRKLRDEPFGPVTAMQPLVWGLLRAHRTEGGEVDVWETSQRGVPRYLDPAEVIHIGFRGLEGPLGVSPLEQLGVTLRIEDAAQRHQQAMLLNGARPPSAITIAKEYLTDQTIEPSERQAVYNSVREQVNVLYAGPENQGRPFVAPPGVDWKGVAHTAVEAELIQQRKLDREEVAACYDITPPLIGILEYATLSNVAEAHRMLYTTILAPWLTLIEETIGAQLIAAESSIRGDVYVEFDLSEVLKGDTLKRAQALALQIAHGVLTIDEAREIENRPRFGLLETSRPLYPANNLRPVGLGFDQPPSDEKVQQAASAMAAMGEDDLRRWLRDAGSVTEAIVNYAVSYAAPYATNGASLNGHHEEPDAS